MVGRDGIEPPTPGFSVLFSRSWKCKVERSHRIDAEEFWNRSSCGSFDGAEVALRDWERVYNHVRFSMALKGRTPAEKLAAVLAAA